MCPVYPTRLVLKISGLTVSHPQMVTHLTADHRKKMPITGQRKVGGKGGTVIVLQVLVSELTQTLISHRLDWNLGIQHVVGCYEWFYFCMCVVLYINSVIYIYSQKKAGSFSLYQPQAFNNLWQNRRSSCHQVKERRGRCDHDSETDSNHRTMMWRESSRWNLVLEGRIDPLEGTRQGAWFWNR